VIVADTNLIAYLMFEGELTASAEAVLRTHPEWSAPYLWRSEFNNVLAIYLRQDELQHARALEYLDRAEQLVEGREYFVPSRTVLDLVQASTCSAYDCEFVALAKELAVPLITADRRILRSFPETATDLREFAPRTA
jgi:predicted nucleic acid-binding protein